MVALCGRQDLDPNAGLGRQKINSKSTNAERVFKNTIQ